MKNKTREKLKILSSLTACILSTFAAITLTFSWFAYNKNGGGGGMDISLESNKTILGSEYYVCKYENGAYTLGDIDAAKTLGVYDILESDYHRVLKIYVAGSIDTVNTITVSAETSTAYFLGNADGTATDETGAVVPYLNPDGGNVLSSVATMGGVSVTDSTVTLNSDGLKTFITADNGKAKPVNFTLSLTPVKDTYTTADGTVECVACYVLITYDANLITEVYSANIGQDIYKYENNVLVPTAFEADFSLKITVG